MRLLELDMSLQKGRNQHITASSCMTERNIGHFQGIDDASCRGRIINIIQRGGETLLSIRGPEAKDTVEICGRAHLKWYMRVQPYE
jgi:hypothetical protein